MPELPEVTVITEQLNKKLRGLVLESVKYDWPKKFDWGKYSIKDLKRKKVEKVERIGKIVVISLANGQLGNWAIGHGGRWVLFLPTDLQTHYPTYQNCVIIIKLPWLIFGGTDKLVSR